jgi:hypothetical protein
MADLLLSTFLRHFKALSPAFTKPGLINALVIMVGWLQTHGPHAITQSLVETAVAGRRHHEAFHRFFSRGTWRPDHLGQLLFAQIVKHLVEPGAVIDLVLDDTLVSKKGPTIFGIGNHLDPVKSSKATQIFTFGHVWVVLSVVVRFPFSRRPWALPILFRLYRSKKEHAHKRCGHYFKKTELARQMLDTVHGWMPRAKFRVAADIAYSNDTVLRELPANIVFIGAMRADAVLTAAPTEEDRKQTGRRRIRGKVLPKPTGLAKSASQRWQKLSVFIYGRKQTIEYKTVDAQWYRAAGARLLRVVVVRVTHGKIPVRVFFSTDLSLSVVDIIETYAGRWSTEVCFRDLKQQLGFGDSQARLKNAVERTAPFVGYTYTLLVLWFATDATSSSPLATPPLRPWYRHKRGFCFADVLRTAQRVLGPHDVLDLANDFKDLWQGQAKSPPASSTRESEAA